MQINVNYAQSISVEVGEYDTIEQMVEKVKNEVEKQLYSGHKYLEFIIVGCEECPELIDEMLE